MGKKKFMFTELLPILVWAMIVVVPSMSSVFFSGDWSNGFREMLSSAINIMPLLILYYVNYYLFIPKVLYKGEVNKFVLLNIVGFLLYFGLHLLLSYFFRDPRAHFEFRHSFVFMLWSLPWSLLICIMAIGFAMGLKFYELRNQQLIEEKERKNEQTEAELTWLKNQLNPHFLFNSLNNISCQIYTDPDEAQENLSRLSSLLRYALYETNSEFVPVKGEIEFMNDYIALMKLRCTDRTTVDVDFNVDDPNIKILPLLYISLIENAFKHGVSNNSDSFVNISFKKEDNRLVFRVRNSNFPKTDGKRSGSGIGIENLKRRLQLAYPKRHNYISELRGNEFFSELSIDI
ncbi:MAG: histidine kinase [Bacteroidales bacterium]|nr:histidine kinase [Bacteroidales bacterium]